MPHMKMLKKLSTNGSNKRNQTIPLSGPIFLTKSEDFAKQLGDCDFKANTGLLERFKMRHNIVCRSVCGESAVVSREIEDEWVKNKLLKLI